MRPSIVQLTAFVSKKLFGAKSYSTVNKMTEPLVTIKQGRVKGSQQSLPDGSPYYSFKGIPYGFVPARFMAPQPAKPWQGVLDATKHGPVCTQYDVGIKAFVPGDENCLYLNVYSKSIDSNNKLPVMVFIHGGAYMSGSGDSQPYGPEFLIQHDVILVTINYRLEALGFLCLDTPEVPGNAGMRDQVTALKWVKDNIEHFGGNPEDVTLFGESAGSSSVVFHMMSPMSKGLFQKAILQSGVSIADWALGREGKERAFRAVNYLGNNTNDTTEALKFLQSVPAEKLAKITFRTMTEDEKLRGLPIHFGPVIEKKFDNVEPFLSEEPLDLLIAGKIEKIPTMLGYTSDESILMLIDNIKKLEFINANPRYLVPREISSRVTEEKEKEFGERIKKFYADDKGFTEDEQKNIVDMQSDIHFIYPIHRFAHFYSSLTKTYMYRFSLDTELNIVKIMSGFDSMKGTAHADDLFYIFCNVLNREPYEKDPKIREIVFNLTKLWTNFAKTGNPTPDNSLGVTWTPYTASNRTYFDINEKYTAGLNEEKTRIDFWNKLYCDAGVPSITKCNL